MEMRSAKILENKEVIGGWVKTGRNEFAGIHRDIKVAPGGGVSRALREGKSEGRCANRGGP